MVNSAGAVCSVSSFCRYSARTVRAIYSSLALLCAIFVDYRCAAVAAKAAGRPGSNKAAMTPETKKKAAWVSICVACVSGFEGLRQVAYRDPVGIPTICFGETRGVRLGDQMSVEECKKLLAGRVEEFGRGVDRCVTVPMSESRKAALVSFSYNVGTNAFCSSTLVRKLNAGDPLACDELLRWNKAKGITLPGLTTRRKEERKLCLS